jgi:PAS domain S-box-containing protein
VLDQNRTLLFRHFERRYPYLLPVIPAAEECLLVPFYVAGKAVGTIWAIMHSDRRKFDAEDDRVMESLGKFASSAYQALVHIDELKLQVAEREKAEAEVHKLASGLEAKIRRLVEANVVGIVMWNLQGAITEANEAFLHMVQYAREDIPFGRVRWTDLTPAEWRGRDERALAELKASGILRPFQKEYFRKDGSRVPVLLGGALFEGSANEGVAFVLDLTEQKRAEERLRASERSLRELTETIPQMLWSADKDGAIDYCNQRALAYTGLSPEQVPGAGWMKAVHQDDLERMTQAWTVAVSTGEPFQCEFRCLRATDKMYRWCICSALPLRDQEGCVLKWFGSVVDLHDWKEAQQALQTTQAELARVSRLTAMGELAASIAHEVNQPLTAVTNNGNACLQLLAHRNLEPEVLRRALEEIVADGTRASAIIERIRSFIKKTPAERKQLDINEVIQEVLALARRELYENRVLLESQLTKALPLVLADRVQLQQVLLNLIRNGIEAMTSVTDRPHILWLQSGLDESGDVLLAVRDSGIGLSLERDRVFTPFFTTKANGMGMGLPISRSLIEAHGGRLWAAENFPDGAVFSFTLPLAGGSPI